MAADHPLFGTGFATFGGNLADYQQDMTLGQNTHIRDTPVHNTPLSVLVELGGTGLLLYCAVVYTVIRRAKRVAATRWGRNGSAWVLVFSAVYLFQTQFAIAHDPTTNDIFFALLGVIAGLGRPFTSAVRTASIGLDWPGMAESRLRRATGATGFASRVHHVSQRQLPAAGGHHRVQAVRRSRASSTPLSQTPSAAIGMHMRFSV
jgi:hypothetical protein